MPPCNCHHPSPRPEPFSPLPRPGKVPDWGKWIRDRLAEKGALLAFPSVSAFPDPGAGPNLYLAEDTDIVYRWDGAHYQVVFDPENANDVLEYENRQAFPATGRHGKLYIAADTGSLYRWGDTDYAELLPGKADKVVPAAEGNLAALDAQGNLADSGKKPGDFATATQGAKADTAVQPAAIAGFVDDAEYDAEYGDPPKPTILLKHGSRVVATVDAASFVIDGMVSNVQIVGGNLVITFNTDSGKQPISIPLTDIFDPTNYYTKTATDALLAEKATKADATLTKRGPNHDGFSAWTIFREGVDVTAQITEMPRWIKEADCWLVQNTFVTGDSSAQDVVDVGQDALYLEWDCVHDGIVLVYTATRTALPGYQLGSQTDKPLASEAEAEALRTGKLDKSAVVAPSTSASDSGKAADAKATGDALAGDVRRVWTETDSVPPNTFLSGNRTVYQAARTWTRSDNAKTYRYKGYNASSGMHEWYADSSTRLLYEPSTGKVFSNSSQYLIATVAQDIDPWRAGFDDIVYNGITFHYTDTESVAQVGQLAMLDEVVPASRKVNEKPLSSNVTLTGADIAVSGTDSTKIDTALAEKATKADATLTERYSSWVFSDGDSHTIELNYIDFDNPYWAYELDGLLYGECNVFDTEEEGLSALNLHWANSLGDPAILTATRTALPGYQLGSQSDKPLASEAEAKAIRDGKLDKNRRVFYATCSTASNTPEKSATVADGLGAFALVSGVVVIVKFDSSNKNGSPTLNVGGTGAKSIKRYGNTDGLSNAWQNGEAVEFVYDGANWMLTKAVKADSERFGTVKISDATNGSASDVAVSQKAMHDANDTKLDKTAVVPPSTTANIGQAADAKATGDALAPLQFAQYYPEGNVKSAAEFTTGIKYDDPDTTNRTITVKPFCNTGTATNDNSALVGRVVIPPFVDGDGNGYISDDGTRFKVVGVSEGIPNALSRNLTAIVAPSTVTSIGYYAFENCRSLTSVSLPAATTIGVHAFNYCIALTFVSLPAATTIGESAFDGCASLVSVSLPAATSIGSGAFDECSWLKSVTIGNNVTSIEDGVFSDCSELTNITIPDSVTSIGISVFYGCRNLTSVMIGNGVTNIEHSAFYNCDSLASVDFGDIPRSSVPSLAPGAFNDVTTTCKIIVPDAQYDAWIAASGWSDLVTAGYKFLRHSEWEYVRKYKLDSITQLFTGRSLPQAPTQNEVAEVVKEIFKALGGTISTTSSNEDNP